VAPRQSVANGCTQTYNPSQCSDASLGYTNTPSRCSLELVSPQHHSLQATGPKKLCLDQCAAALEALQKLWHQSGAMMVTIPPAPLYFQVQLLGMAAVVKGWDGVRNWICAAGATNCQGGKVVRCRTYLLSTQLWELEEPAETK